MYFFDLVISDLINNFIFPLLITIISLTFSYMLNNIVMYKKNTKI